MFHVVISLLSPVYIALGRGLVDRKLVEAPRNFIASRPKTVLLFWFFGDFRYGVRLLIVILFIYKNKKVGKNRC